MADFESLSILVTGGAGFIGSHLTERLLQEGARVTVFDNFDPFYNRREKQASLSALTDELRFTLVEADIRDAVALKDAVAHCQPNLLIHLAAKAGVRPSLENPTEYADVNVRGTTNVLECARLSGVRNVIFASSSSVYGNQNHVPLRESDSTDRPLSPYGATKKAGEALCHVYHYVYGLSIACLRFFTVYGPRQRPDLAIRKFVTLALRGDEIPVYGDGTSSRDYTHIRDILTGILGAIPWVQSPAPRYGIYNLGSARPLMLKEMIVAIEQELNQKLRVKRLPFQNGDVLRTFADTTLAEQELGFRHDVSFKDGLCEFVRWMKTCA
jgi:UDP-glucuronate 4-epimerase